MKEQSDVPGTSVKVTGPTAFDYNTRTRYLSRLILKLISHYNRGKLTKQIKTREWNFAIV